MDEQVEGLRVDFVIIGAMKAGSTTLHGWLADQSEVAMAVWKEPSFFSRHDRYAKGVAWYQGLFGTDIAGKITGEASTSYTSPRYAVRAAQRMATHIPNTRLIYLVRHPLDRARSHFRHQVQRGRERRTFQVAVSDPEALYLAQSMYWRCLEPYTRCFPREQILVVRLEDLAEGGGWEAALEHIGLSYRPHPTEIENVTGSKAGFTPLLRWFFERRLTTWNPPLPIRRIGRRLLTRSDEGYKSLMASASDSVPEMLAAEVWADVERLERWLKRSAPLWP
jgi:hypothetical protein